MRRRTRGGLAGVATAIVAGCASSAEPDLGEIYTKAARFHDAERNPVVVIPGILGSKLVDPASGKAVWGAFGGGAVDPETPEGARLVALPMKEGVPLAALRDKVAPAGVLDRVKLSFAGLPIDLNAYFHILKALGVGGYRDEGLALAGAVDYGKKHFTCFQFDYDWRRGNVENARRLHEFLVEKAAYVRSERKKQFGTEGTVKFDVVAHSMGGLLARYYLEYGAADLPADGSEPKITWAGAEQIERLIVVGTPNAGSVQSLIQLVQGASFAPVLPSYRSAILGTMPAVYELLPRARHGAVVLGAKKERGEDLLDVALWEKLGWGLLAPGEESTLAELLPDEHDAKARRRIARDHLRKCLDRARAFQTALDAPASRPKGVSLYLIAGDAVRTAAVVSVDPTDGSLEVAERAPGDGTVLRTSALMDERAGAPWTPRLISPIPWNQVMFLFTDHLGLTRDPAFTDNVLYLLLEDRR
ncbi:hypothetical protein HY251_19350 [bacterium]|nr:hypothetical protein [bacterium]